MPRLSGEVQKFKQPNGKTIQLKVFGDEFYARYEDLDGYTAIRDVDGYFCYAKLDSGRFVPSKVAILDKHSYLLDHSARDQLSITKHIHESAKVIGAKIKESKSREGFSCEDAAPQEHLVDDCETVGACADITDEHKARLFKSTVGLLSGRNVGIYNGTRRRIIGLTILVEFKDETTSITTQDVSNFLNADQYTANGNICSVKKYFSVMSGGKLIYSNYVFGPIKLSQKKDYYKQNLFIREALEGTLKYIHSLWFKAFDSENEHIIDAINFMYAGDTVYEGKLWPHNSIINFPTSVLFSAYKSVPEYKIEYKTNFYMLTSLGKNVKRLKIGTFCHESGHLLCRFPDLYDYGSNGKGKGRDGDDIASAGAGNFCLMSSGNHLGNGGAPAPVCGYLRCLVRWCDNVIDLKTPENYKLPLSLLPLYSIGIYRINEFEFFILENYMRWEFTASLPDHGLAIWHCDLLGSNEWQMGTKDKHYQCALVQADDKQHLEHNSDKGSDGDLYKPKAGIFFSHDSHPSSKQWDGSDSGLIIRDLQSGTGDSLTFWVGDLKPMTQVADVRCYPSAVVESAASSSCVQEVGQGIVEQSAGHSTCQEDFRDPLIFNVRRPPTRRLKKEDIKDDYGYLCGCRVC